MVILSSGIGYGLLKMIAYLLLGLCLAVSYCPFLCNRVFFRCICYFCFNMFSWLLFVDCHISPVVWVGAATGWDLGAILSGASVRVAISFFVGSKDFIDFTQDTAISWGVYELYYTIFLSVNGVTGA